MKLLIALLFTSSISISTFAKSKVDKYFELGTSLDWNKETTTVGGVDSNTTNFTIQATKGYIFKKHWDVSLGFKYISKSNQKVLDLSPKSYAAQVAVKYVFSKRPGLVRHHHKTWMTPYVGLAYQWRRYSPHAIPHPVTGLPVPDRSAKTVEPGYVASLGVRCFMKKNMAVTWDLSYRTAKQITTDKGSGAEELKNIKVTELNPSLSFVYFY